MPIPALLAPEEITHKVTPPAPVTWNQTSVSLIGLNGTGPGIALTGFGGAAWPGMFIQPGATGLDMPPYALFSDDPPNLDGSVFRGARASAREIMIPVYLHGVDRKTINEMKRRLFQSLNPRRGYCVIRFSEGSGQARELKAYYKGGLEGSEGTDTAGFTWARYGLSFTAMDPWFYGTREETVRWSFGTGGPLLNPDGFFPLTITEGVMGGDGGLFPLQNIGDVEAWPVWTLQGPVKSFSLTHEDGRSISASPLGTGADLVPNGRVLTIDTRPGRKTVKDDVGANYWTLLDTNPQFWEISPGESLANIQIVTGAGKASISVSFLPRYASYV